MADETKPDPEDGAGDDDATTKLKANNAKLQQELADARRAKRELETKQAERDAADAQAEEERQRKAGEFEGLLTKATADRDKYKALYEGLIVSDGLTKSLADAKVAPQYMEAVSALLKAKGVTLNKDGAALIENRPLADFVRDWAVSEAGKPFVLNGNSGGGAPGGSGGAAVNPWKRDQRNLTEQDRIEAQNPALAGRLKAEAGVA